MGLPGILDGDGQGLVGALTTAGFGAIRVKNQCVVDNHQYPFDYPLSGFGLYCVRCHAATQSPGAEPAADANEFTFASLRNITRLSGDADSIPRR